MKPHWFYILLSVSSAPRYGSAIQEDVRTLSDGKVRLWPATLYGSLEEMTARGWLEEVGPPGDEGSVGRERYYRPTPRGREALRAEVDRMERVAGVARTRLGGGSVSA